MAPDVFNQSLSRAGVRLLNHLINTARERHRQTQDPIFIFVEHCAEALNDADLFASVFERAEGRLRPHLTSEEAAQLEGTWQMLGHVPHLGQAFAEMLWLAYLFHSEAAAEALWPGYQALHQQAALDGVGRAMPTTWGGLAMLMGDLMGQAYDLLQEESIAFLELTRTPDTLELLEAALLANAAPSADPVAGRLVFEPAPPAHFEPVAVLLAYLQACCRDLGFIDPYDLRSPQSASVPLGDVFTPLKVGRARPPAPPEDSVRCMGASLPRAKAAPGLASLAQAIEVEGGLLLLGERGAGKSTLLRHLGCTLATQIIDDQAEMIDVLEGGALRLGRKVPLYLDMAEFLEGRGPAENLEAYLLRRAAALTSDAHTTGLLSRLLREGQCLVMLDGLDRAVTHDQRRGLLAQAGQAALSWLGHGCQVIVSSRPHTLGLAALSEALPAYEVSPLDRGQVSAFAVRWRLMLSRLERPLIPYDEALRRAQGDMLAMARQVVADDRLYRLAANPLTLRMLAAAYQPGMRLPNRRMALYHLLMEGRSLPTGHDEAAPQQALFLLGELALWLHEARPTGLITGGELHSVLAHIWAGRHSGAAAAGQADGIQAFIAQARASGDVFVEHQPGLYGFLNPLIQHYFGARSLVASFRLAPARLRAHLHDPHWHALITDAIGFVALSSAENAADLVEAAILGRDQGMQAGAGASPSPYEAWLHRDLFFAAGLLAEGIDLGQGLMRHILKPLMGMWLDADRDSPGRFRANLWQAYDLLRRMDGTPAAAMAAQMAAAAFDDRDERRRAHAFEVVSLWPTQAEALQRQMLAAAPDILGQPQLARRAAAGALGRAERLSFDAFRTLVTLTRDPDPETAALSRAALARAENIPQQALDMWARYISSPNPVEQSIGLRVLRQVGTLPGPIIAELLHLIAAGEPAIGQAAVETMASLSHLPENALLSLCYAITEAPSAARAAAIEAFNRPVMLPAEVEAHLICWLDDPDPQVRRAAAGALGTALNRSPQIVEALGDHLSDPSDSIRAEVIGALARAGAVSERARHLLAHLARDLRASTRRAMAAALSRCPAFDAGLERAWLTLLADPNAEVRLAALGSLAAVPISAGPVITQLEQATRSSDPSVSSGAVAALAAQRHLPAGALLALAEALPGHWRQHGQAIAACLQAHRPLDGPLLYQVMDLAAASGRGVEPGLRAVALDVLAAAQADLSASVEVLLAAAQAGENLEVRLAALHGLAQAPFLISGGREALLHLAASGPLEVRGAAAAALAHLVDRLPDGPFDGAQAATIADLLAALISEASPRAAWEHGAAFQDQLLEGLARAALHSQPGPPLLPA